MIGDGPVRPPSLFPHKFKQRSTRAKTGAGSDSEESWGGIKKAGWAAQAAGGISRNPRPKLTLRLTQCEAQQLRKWNGVQDHIEFVGVRPRHKLEHQLLTPGSISDDEASRIAARIRTEAGYSADDGIVVFTERRVFDDTYYQLFVGGREADEEPPRIAVLSLCASCQRLVGGVHRFARAQTSS